jgi:hypothetical protein
MARRLVVTVLAAAVAALSMPVGTAYPADRQVLGKRLEVRDPTGVEARRKVKVLGRERPTDIASITGDPTVGGATLRVIANGGTDSDESYVLDAAGWTPVGGGFRYRGPTGADGDPVHAVLLKRTAAGAFLLKALVRGATGTQDLAVVPPNPGDDGGIVLDIVGGDRYCVSFGGAADGTESHDTSQRWRVKNATAEPGCPTPPSTTTTSTTTTTTATTTTSTTTTTTPPACGNGVIEAGEQCDPPGGPPQPDCGSPAGAFLCDGSCMCQAVTTTTTTAPPTTTTTTPPATTTTTTTLPGPECIQSSGSYPQCGGTCPPGQVCAPQHYIDQFLDIEYCFCVDANDVCGVPNNTSCDGVCPPGKTCEQSQSDPCGTCVLQPTRCCQISYVDPNDACLDALEADAIFKCTYWGEPVATLAPPGAVCDGMTGTCGAVKSPGTFCCECEAPVTFPHPTFCFDSADNHALYICRLAGCVDYAGLACDPVTERCEASPSGAFLETIDSAP